MELSFFTGYLKQCAQKLEGRNLFVTMAIPNEEIAYIYENTISSWFREELQIQNLTPMYQALFEGKVLTFQKGLQDGDIFYVNKDNHRKSF